MTILLFGNKPDSFSCKSETRTVLHFSFKMASPTDVNNSNDKTSTGSPPSSRSPSHGKQCAAFGCMSWEHSVVDKMRVSTGMRFFPSRYQSLLR